MFKTDCHFLNVLLVPCKYNPSTGVILEIKPGYKVPGEVGRPPEELSTSVNSRLQVLGEGNTYLGRGVNSMLFLMIFLYFGCFSGG